MGHCPEQGRFAGAPYARPEAHLCIDDAGLGVGHCRCATCTGTYPTENDGRLSASYGGPQTRTLECGRQCYGTVCMRLNAEAFRPATAGFFFIYCSETLGSH